ncbi:MAG: EcsC family protein [Eubacterium sp.]|jgi:hypothetical protein|nr:EcsC family protein [Eubacterium sp.]
MKRIGFHLRRFLGEVNDLKNKRDTFLRKELVKVQKAEENIKKSAVRSITPTWKSGLEQKIPPKAKKALNTAFGKAFALIFEKGTGIIEKTYDKKEMEQDYIIRDYAIQLKGGRKEIRQIRKEAAKSDLMNLAAATAEGVGLGIFGIGVPDIVLFVGVLLKGIYQSALNYGVNYEHLTEKYLILKMMEAAMAKGEEFEGLNQKLDCYLQEGGLQSVSKEQFEGQVQKTAEAFAADMMFLKFIQGIPVAGILGGMANPVCYHKVMRYVGIKYHKRYLLKLIGSEGKKDGGT